MRGAFLASLLNILLVMWGARGHAEPPDPFERGLALFKERKFAAAVPWLEQTRQLQPDDGTVKLLLGICLYRNGDLARAEPLLRQAARQSDSEFAGAARLFLGLLLQEQGAVDAARVELERAARVPDLAGGAQRLMQANQTRRLTLTLLLSPEFDGNVPFTDLNTWNNQTAGSADGDLLMLASLSVRPFKSVGLTLGNTLSYRQQLNLQDYNLLLNSTWVGYRYQGEDNGVRGSLAMNWAMLGGSLFYGDVSGRITYFRRLKSEIQLMLTYEGRYRSYQEVKYSPFSGHTHTLQAELGWGLIPEPLSASIGYQAVREELRTPDPADPDYPTDDYRAWAHGPLLRVRARLRRIVELLLIGSALQRRFDYLPPTDLRRMDWYLFSDFSVSVDARRWLETFAGVAFIYNQSTDPAWTYFKPVVYLGVAARFSFL